MLKTINEEISNLRDKIDDNMQFVSQDELSKLYNSLTDITSMILDEVNKREV